MRVLVAGGAGFLGSHLIQHLLSHKPRCEITVVDNLLTGKIQNIKEATGFRGKVEKIFVADVASEADIKKVFAHEDPFDFIFNFACPASPPKYQADPISTMMTNVVGTKNLLQMAREDGSVFIQASTSEIYGDPTIHPQVESYRGTVNSFGPRACYDEGKRAAEALCYDYKHTHGVNVKVVRIFNTYGPRMDPKDGRVVTNFIVQSLKGQKFTAYGNGQQTRSFCYVSDLIEGILKVAETSSGFTGPINLGNPNEFTIKELGTLVHDAVHGEIGPENGVDVLDDSFFNFLPLPKDDPCVRQPDITLAKQTLDWEPKVSIKQGLRKTVEYLRGRI